MEARESQDAAISVHGLVTRIGGHMVHDHLDLEVKRGEIMALIGDSGSGKSVFMRTLLGLLPAESGEIRVLGENPEALDAKALQALRRRWGVLFQDGALFTTLTVAENIQMPMRELGQMSKALMDELAALKIRLVGLPADAAVKYPSELSGGMKRRAGLARALALDPELLFLDEPTSGLDPISAAEFDALLVELQRALNMTVLMVTHDSNSVRNTADRVAALVNKKLVIGTPKDTNQNPDPWIRAFFGAQDTAVPKEPSQPRHDPQPGA
jgi:phospholipid/cholesterol/gamma-HCH transport system ATP-binding protein